jgi:hypothetical protein
MNSEPSPATRYGPVSVPYGRRRGTGWSRNSGRSGSAPRVPHTTDAAQGRLDAIGTMTGLNENDLIEVAIRLARRLYECRASG